MYWLLTIEFGPPAGPYSKTHAVCQGSLAQYIVNMVKQPQHHVVLAAWPITEEEYMLIRKETGY